MRGLRPNETRRAKPEGPGEARGAPGRAEARGALQTRVLSGRLAFAERLGCQELERFRGLSLP